MPIEARPAHVPDWPDPTPSYDLVASAYEAKFVGELDHKPRDRELLTTLAAGLQGAAIAVDLGCGPGQIGAFVASRSVGAHVAGLDRSEAMARLAARRLGGGGVVGDLRALPFGDGRLDAVTAFYCLIHLPRGELGGAVGEIARVLRPGARALLTAHEGEGEVQVDEFLGEQVRVASTFFQLDELVGACEAAGLEVTLAERRPPGPTEGTSVRLTVLAVRP